MKPTIIASFSGGRTSAYMVYKLKKHWAGIFDIYILFANTGQEDERTLAFVDRCDKEFDLGVIWLEAKVSDGKNSGTSYKVVTFETASRDGQPFIDVCSKYGLPSSSYLHCTRELKMQPMFAWRRENTHKFAMFAVGIRVDEFDRISNDDKKHGLIYPLISNWPTKKIDVMNFWRRQSFDLEVPEHLGNCLWCYKKSDKKLKMVHDYNPKIFDFPRMLESRFENVNAPDKPREIFRQNRNTDRLIETFDIADDTPNGCGEQCDAFGY